MPFPYRALKKNLKKFNYMGYGSCFKKNGAPLHQNTLNTYEKKERCSETQMEMN